jgi:N-acetylneuraminate lyase
MSSFTITDMKGVIPAMITAFDKNENIDEVGMRECIQHLIKKNVNGLYITGSTGESFLMSTEERKRVVEIVVDEVSGKIPVIAHIGSIGTKTSIMLAEHAQEIGVDGLSSLPPFYYSFSPEQIINYYTDITKSSDLSMIAYNISLVGLMGFEMLKKLSDIKGVAGVKYTASTHFDIMRIKKEIGKNFIIHSGSDEMAMSGLLSGADGIIGSFFNLMPEVFISLKKAIDANDIKQAKELQGKANTIIFFSLARSPYSVIKRGMAWQGANAGYCRRPFDNFYELESENKLKDEFRQLKKDNDLSGIHFLDSI